MEALIELKVYLIFLGQVVAVNPNERKLDNFIKKGIQRFFNHKENRIILKKDCRRKKYKISLIVAKR